VPEQNRSRAWAGYRLLGYHELALRLLELRSYHELALRLLELRSYNDQRPTYGGSATKAEL
jgi:hypothetical protein